MSARIKAFLTHLSGSLVVLAFLLYLIVYHWYPQPFFSADGGWQGIRLIAGIDVILGPLLTLLIYNPRKGKRKLAIDMTMILIFQLIALSIGSYIVHDQRTQLVVFADDHFESLSDPLVKELGIKQELLEKLRKNNPTAIAYVRLPTDEKERADMIMKTVFSGRPLSERVDRYEPLTSRNRQEIMKHGLQILKNVAKHPEEKSKLDAFLAQHGGGARDYAYLQLIARYDEALLVMSRKNGEIVGSIPINPSRIVNK